MAIANEHSIDIDITSGSTYRSFQHKIAGGGDNNANKYGVRLLRNKAPVSLTGAACVAYFIRPDGITLVISGEIRDDTAYVTLPAAAYAKEGNFTLTIKITGTGFADSFCVIDGTVIMTSTGEINDPSDVIPSLAELMNVIGQAEDAAEAIFSLTITAEQIEGTRYMISVVKEE